MTLKRIYNLRNQRITNRHDDLSKMCVCILLVLCVICGLIGLTIYFVKIAQSNLIKEYGHVNYHDVGNNQISQTKNKRPDVKTDYLLTSVEGTIVATSNTAEFTSTTIESPLSTSTMSPKDVPPRFLILKTINAIDISHSDYSTAGSTNDYVQFTAESVVDSLVKRSTRTDLMDDAPITVNGNFIDEYLHDNSGREPTTEKLHSVEHIDKYVNTTPKTKLDVHHQTCTTELCKQSSSRMLALVNHTAKPCEDFYSYACGGFDINHFKEITVNDNVLESLPDMSTLDLTVPYKKLYRDFFLSCTNYANGRGLKELSKLLYDLCQNHKENLTDLIADIIMIHPKKALSRLLPLFDVVMEVGPKKTLIPTLGLPKLNSFLEHGDKNLYERLCLNSIKMQTMNKKNKTAIQTTYKACIEDQREYLKNLEKSIFLLQIFEHLPEFKKSQMITDTVQFIKDNIIDKFGVLSDEEFANAEYDTVIVALEWLNSAYPKIEWKKLFEKLFGNEVAENITEIRLTHSIYLEKIFKFYNSHTFENIKTSILSMMAHDMYIDFIEPHPTSDRFEYCSKVATKLMPDIASKLYLENFRSTDILHTEIKFKKMFGEIIETFNASLNEKIWVNNNVRNDVSQKISELNVICNPYSGFSNFDKNFDQLYRGVSISTNDYISNVFSLKQVVRRRMYDTYGKSALSPEIIWNYLAWPISDSPIRITETTTIVLPTSLIAKLTHESRKIEEYSTIGYSVAQEISRLLYIDKKSRLVVNENEDLKANVDTHLLDTAYFKRSNIFGIQLNEKDIIASEYSRFIDDVALRVTYDAYDQFQSQFDEQLPWTDDSISKTFYLITSQQFCTAKKSTVEVAINLMHNEILPNYFRVNYMMMNSKSFLKTFKCQN